MDDRMVNLEELTKPFPREALKQRRGDGKSLTYVEGHTVIRRLNAATNNNWNFEVKSVDSTDVGEDKNHNPRLLWKVRGALTIPGCGTRESIGVQVASLGTGEDLIKGAFTDCIKKCATLFGVALELYGPDYEDEGESVDRMTGEIRPQSQPQRPAPAQPQQPSMNQPVIARDEAAKTLWDLAKGMGMSRDVLGKYAGEKIKKPLEECDTKELLKLCNALRGERDVPAMIDVLTNKPASQAPLTNATPADRTPAQFR